MNEQNYREEVAQDVSDQLATLHCQPVVFAGAGLSRRWFGAPSWTGLLQHCVEDCPEIRRPYAYYAQSYGYPPAIASALAEAYREWAWAEGNNSYPQDLFQADVPSDAYLKYSVAEKVTALEVGIDGIEDPSLRREVDALQKIRPHCLITTNFDCALEEIFPDYEVVLGGDLIVNSFASIGEIIKIHGSVTDFQSLVLTSEDYDRYLQRRKYMSAKLLTFFNEHPLLFCGYSASDENICGILSDIDEALAIPGQLIPNIFFLERREDDQPAQREKLIRVGENRSVRVKCIQTNDFAWVFEAFGHRAPLGNVNPKVLRSIMARSYHLVRSDIPRQNVEVDFDTIQRRVESEESFASLFGVATMLPASELSARYPYNLTEVGKMLGGRGWHVADRLLKRVRDEKGVDIKASDNRYHWAIETGNSRFKKYSDECVELLRRVQAGEEYSVEIE